MSDELRSFAAQLMSGFAGQNAVLTIPRPYLTLCDNDHRAALLLSQCVYWSDRTQDEDGWFAKSYADWSEELGLSEYEVRRAAKALSVVGLETKVKKFNGAPVVHYRIDKARFSESILKKLQYPSLSIFSMDTQKTSGSLTESTTETTTKRKDSSTGVEAVSDTTTSNPEQEPDTPSIPKPGRPRNPMFDAVSWAWRNTSGGYVAKLIKFLEGRCTPRDGLYYQWQISPPMTPVEVVGFRLWRDYLERDVPTVPETLQRTIEEFRGVPEYERVMAAAHKKLADLTFQWEAQSASSSSAAATAPELDEPPADEAIHAPTDLLPPGDVDAVFEAMGQRLGGRYDTGRG